jgi:hypothetical protein
MFDPLNILRLAAIATFHRDENVPFVVNLVANSDIHLSLNSNLGIVYKFGTGNLCIGQLQFLDFLDKRFERSPLTHVALPSFAQMVSRLSAADSPTLTPMDQSHNQIDQVNGVYGCAIVSITEGREIS